MWRPLRVRAEKKVPASLALPPTAPAAERLVRLNRRKRLLDLALTIPAAPLLLPVIGTLALAVRLGIGSPVLFRQQRPGLHGHPFTLYKFRTMTDARDSAGKLLADGQRLTTLGRFLRRSSLDELPELFNVLRGEMSLVGPRPLLLQYLPFYTEREQLRHALRPGLSGWAQIHGRNRLPWDERLAMDVWYVENWTLGLDLRILLLTFWKVLRRDGVAADTDTVEVDLDLQRRHPPCPPS